MRAVIYSRVSTDAQERDGTSLETQERACVEYAAANGWTVVERLRDTASGFSLERPGLSRVRKMASAGEVDVVLAHALDRLSRKQTHVAILVEEMEELGVALDFVTEKFEDTATGQLLRSVKAFAAEFEREKIAERTMRGKAERAKSGRLPQGTGRGLYGYRYDPDTGRREIIERQAVVVRRVFTEFVSGASIVGLTNRLNEEGVLTMTGKQWSPATVFHLLQREPYAGRTVYRRTKATKVRDRDTGAMRRRVIERDPSEWIEVPDATPAIVPRDLFDAAQARLRDPERLRHGRRRSTYALAGRIRCKVCGASMVGQALQRGRYRYYRCRKAYSGARHDRCDSRYVRADRLEHAVLSEVAGVLSEPEIVLAELGRFLRIEQSSDDVGAAASRIKSLENQRLRLLKLFQLGEIDDDYLQRELQSIRQQTTALEQKTRALGSPAFDMPSPEQFSGVCAKVKDWVLTRGPEDLRLVAEALQIRLVAGPDSCEMTGVVPEYAPADGHADVRAVVSKPS